MELPETQRQPPSVKYHTSDIRIQALGLYLGRLKVLETLFSVGFEIVMQSRANSLFVLNPAVNFTRGYGPSHRHQRVQPSKPPQDGREQIP